ncbi:MAG: TetR/AcrR family transcriptional regulator [Alphaproteobacteria bacterium]|nr:TetR/AcrR family transcriptional regulator [Alphaproteobacteria bacterium]
MSGATWNGKVASRDEQRQQKRMAVLTTAAALFNRRGYDRTSLDDIAKELNVSKRTLYYYVESKDDILFQCNRLAIAFMEDAMRASRDKDRPPLDRLAALLRSYMSLLSTEFGACLVLIGDLALTEDSRNTLRRGRKNLDNTVRRLIREGIEDGSIAPCDPKYAAAAIFGAFNWVPYWFGDSEKIGWDKLADHLLKTLLDGLRSRA